MRLYSVFDVKSHAWTKNTILKEIESSPGYQCTTRNFKGDYTSLISRYCSNCNNLVILNLFK